jgi:Rnl2 family RNA ligase
MLQFKKYNSIENTYDKEFMEKIKLEVHGANCCLVTDGQTVRFAKRTGLVETGEMFYNYEELLERYQDRIVRLFHRVKTQYTDTESLLVYGEMFGGKYPHPDVKNDSKVMNIQKGVFYFPAHEFYGFDLYVNGLEQNRYLPVDEVNQFFEGGNIFYAKTLFQGTLDECLEYPNAFQSCIAGWLGLPPVEDNICEGNNFHRFLFRKIAIIKRFRLQVINYCYFCILILIKNLWQYQLEVCLY